MLKSENPFSLSRGIESHFLCSLHKTFYNQLP